MERHDNKFGPRILRKLELSKKMSRECFSVYSGGMMFEVESGERSFVVNLGSRTCTCGMFQLSGIPCGHAVSAIWFHKHEPEDYVHEYYHRETYLRTYNMQIFPVPTNHEWLVSPQGPISPPMVKRTTGRPKKQRKRTADELHGNTTGDIRRGVNVTCSRCLEKGHNQRSCKNNPHPHSKLFKVCISLLM